MRCTNWNVTSIIDNSGTVEERFAYSAYGEPVFLNSGFAEQANSSHEWERLFAGYLFDGDAEGYIVRHRVYMPQLGWLQRDPLGYADGASLYGYCVGWPSNRMDPAGTKCEHEMSIVATKERLDRMDCFCGALHVVDVFSNDPWTEVTDCMCAFLTARRYIADEGPHAIQAAVATLMDCAAPVVGPITGAVAGGIAGAISCAGFNFIIGLGQIAFAACIIAGASAGAFVGMTAFDLLIEAWEEWLFSNYLLSDNVASCNRIL